MRSSSGKLLLLLSGCLPEQTELKRRLLIEKICGHPAYRELFYHPLAKQTVEGIFSRPALSGCTAERLEELFEMLPILHRVLYRLMIAYQYYDISPLCGFSESEIFQKDSLERLDQVCASLEPSENYTNLAPEEFFMVFDPSVQGSVAGIAEMTPPELASPELAEALREKFKGEKYCISETAVEELRLQALERSYR